MQRWNSHLMKSQGGKARENRAIVKILCRERLPRNYVSTMAPTKKGNDTHILNTSSRVEDLPVKIRDTTTCRRRNST